MSEQGEVTRLLVQLGHGGRDAMDRVLPMVYGELQRLAQRQLRGERGDHTLQATDLVHEAYVKLGGLERIEWKNRAQFFAIAAQAMRRVLVDHAVGRQAAKRGGERRKVPLDEAMLVLEEQTDDVLALNAALSALERSSPRLVRIVECRYFAGLSIEETAEALEISPATVKRDWTMARAWLSRELSG
ncbi:MAG TPA: ECF-type sigma factor [Longimicrobiaceae bacterium]|nr:ECF-type sigma factor [Longimicrobiaceae bacterium]